MQEPPQAAVAAFDCPGHLSMLKNWEINHPYIAFVGLEYPLTSSTFYPWKPNSKIGLMFNMEITPIQKGTTGAIDN